MLYSIWAAEGEIIFQRKNKNKSNSTPSLKSIKNGRLKTAAAYVPINHWNKHLNNRKTLKPLKSSSAKLSVCLHARALHNFVFPFREYSLNAIPRRESAETLSLRRKQELAFGKRLPFFFHNASGTFTVNYCNIYII